MTFFADGEDLAEGDVEDPLREMAPALHRSVYLTCFGCGSQRSPTVV